MHARVVRIGVVMGMAALWTAAFACATESWLLLRVTVIGSLWGCLAMTYLGVAHRMIPFFSASALPRYEAVKPAWTLYLLVGASAFHGLLAMAGAAPWAWPVDLAAAVTALWLSWKWQFRRSFAVRLLAMLHIGFIWLGLAWLMAGIQGLLHVAGIEALGLAPLHAMAVGFFATMTLAMVSRVSLGHSGRPLVADTLTWRLALGLHGVAALRVAADLLPVGHTALPAIAALGWLAVFLPWASRLVPIYLSRRADGKPG